MNHAFIMQVHAYPELFGDILRQLEAPNHYFFINVDKKTDIKPFIREVQGLGNIFFQEGMKRIRVNHGGFSQIQCTLNLIDAVLSYETKIDYIHSISGQDFPCVSNDVFDRYFLADGERSKSFMWFDTSEEIAEWRKEKYPKRYRPYYFIDTRWTHIDRLDDFIMRALRKTVGKIYLKPEDEKVVAGWSWFSWHRSVAGFVMNYFTENPGELTRYKYTYCCDEIIFHTLLQDKLEELRIERNMPVRFIVWHPKRPARSLPLVLNENEYDEIVNSGALICRKIHPEESKSLISRLKDRITGMTVNKYLQ